jgi:hypothetical protein
MSGPERPEPTVETTRSLKRKNLSKDDQDELDALDKVFKRVKTAVPRTPYILSTPSLTPYRYHSQQEAHAWMLGRLFKTDEEHLQYRTYVYREPCQDCLELQAGEDDDPEPEHPPSRASNIGGQVAKKKINLGNFKVKQANGTVTPGSKKVSPTQTPANGTQEQVNGVKRPEKQESDSRPQTRYASCASEGRLGLTCDRPTDEARDPHKAAKSNAGADPATRPPRSPARKTDNAASKINIDKSDNSGGTPHGLPPLLSPVHISAPGNPYGLPDILSPTLPSNIQTELNKIESQRKRAESSASASSTDRKSQTLAVPGTKTQKPTDAVKAEPRIRSVSVNGKSPNVEHVKAKEEPVKAKEEVKARQEQDPSLVVKLKFSKTKAATVTQLLKLKPAKQKKESQDTKEIPHSSQPKAAEEEPKKKKPIPKVAARRSDNTTPASTPSAKPNTTTPASKLPEKRPRADDDLASAVPSKRPKAPSSQDCPHTPAAQVVSSPSISNKSSAQKTQPHATPKNNHKAISMLRTASTDSNDSTPGRSVATPAGVKVGGKSGPTSAPLTDKKQADFNLLNQVSMKLNQMGRALKHEATKILQTASGKPGSKQDEKRAAVTNMECIL